MDEDTQESGKSKGQTTKEIRKERLTFRRAVRNRCESTVS